MNKFSVFVFRFRLYIILLFIIITGFFSFQLTKIGINADITTYLPASDSAVSRFNYIGTHFSSSTMAIIIIESENDIFEKETIGHISELTQTLRETEGVDYVTSITNITDIKKTEEGLEIGKLIDENNLPSGNQELQLLKNYALSKSLYKGRFISNDSRYSLMICRLNQESDKNKIASTIKNKILQSEYPEKFYFEGMPFQFLSIMDYVVRDLLILTPLIILVIIIILFLFFRSMRGILIPIATVAMGIIWALGMMSLAGVELSPLSDAIPVVLFAVGSAYSIHVLTRFGIMVNSRETKIQDCTSALKSVSLPVLLSGVTTVMGFLSFVLGAYLNIVSEFGFFSALGVVFILVISLTFTPALTSYFPIKKSHLVKNKKAKPGFYDSFLRALSNLTVNHPKRILIPSVVILVVSVTGIPFISNNIDILNYFKPHTDIRKSAKVMNTEFGGSLPVMVRVRGDISSPEVMKKMKFVQNFLDKQPDINNASSVVELIEEMNYCMGEGKKIPDTRDKIANLWFLIEGDELLKQMVNQDKTEALIQAYMNNADTKRYHEVTDSLNAFLQNLSDSECTFDSTGMPYIYSNLDDSLLKNLYQSLVISIILILICMVFLLRSLKGAFIGMLPLSFSIVVIFGFMGITGIALDIATILIAGITVGTGIDFTIHFISEYKKEILAGNTIPQAIDNTIKVSGRSIIINVITIIFGFIVLLFANLNPLVNFGILLSITMLFSGLGAVTLLPSMLSYFKLKLVPEKLINKKNIHQLNNIKS